MKEILSHVRDKSCPRQQQQAYHMVCLSDMYRSGELEDDDNQSAESKWLLTAAQQGYIPAIALVAELFTVGNFYFKKDQITADTLYSLIAAAVKAGEEQNASGPWS
jgi:TPR repeat protein